VQEIRRHQPTPTVQLAHIEPILVHLPIDLDNVAGGKAQLVLLGARVGRVAPRVVTKARNHLACRSLQAHRGDGALQGLTAALSFFDAIVIIKWEYGVTELHHLLKLRRREISR